MWPEPRVDRTQVGLDLRGPGEDPSRGPGGRVMAQGRAEFGGVGGGRPEAVDQGDALGLGLPGHLGKVLGQILHEFGTDALGQAGEFRTHRRGVLLDVHRLSCSSVSMVAAKPRHTSPPCLSWVRPAGLSE
jgi:hypothetical protein